jgi:hypothetical protein
MPTGISLHLGLNRVNPAHYQGWDGALAACEYDAKDLQAIAQSRGFAQSRLLLTADATAANVIAGITEAARACQAGDLFLLTYSGHGGQVPDTNHDEKRLPTGLRDNYDETWVLYDRQLIDDELYTLWGRFRKGVRLLVLSDSCHSGTVIKALPTFLDPAAAAASGPAIRWLPLAQSQKVYRANRKLYDALQRDNPTAENTRVRAAVLLISGCMDNQFSLDGPRNGLFTGTLRKVWNNGRFTGGHQAFRNAIASRMPPSQTPNFFRVGAGNAAFESQTPFTI